MDESSVDDKETTTASLYLAALIALSTEESIICDVYVIVPSR